MRKIILFIAVLGLFFWVGCSEMETYSNGVFSVDYPNDYSLTEYNSWVVTISNDKGKIFVGDFQPDVGPYPTADMTQEQIDKFPKDTMFHNEEPTVASALFYSATDPQTMNELKWIQDSVMIK